MINLIVVLVVLGIAFMMVAPETGDKMSSLSEITIGAMAVFIVITVIRMILAGRRS
ncbi:hypothetical protein [Megamonas hypermegale]|uniref:hypothetical protein n=1 Tax=Megamonas hypermegale TaxID=158847 RepID=UPI0026EBA022|nr:hypothetical protein [Megamonas hypermegale]